MFSRQQPKFTQVCSAIKWTKDSSTHREQWSVVGQIWEHPDGGYLSTMYSHGFVPVYNALIGWAVSVEASLKHFFAHR